MTNTNVINTDGDLHFVHPAWLTRLSSNDEPPTVTPDPDEVPELNAVRVVQSAGGQQLDYAELSWRVLEPLVDRDQPAGFSRMLDVLLPDEDKTRIHLGDYTTETEDIDDEEVLTGQSELRNYHFGDTFAGQRWHVSGDDDVTIDDAPVFNPRIDDRIHKNRSDKKRHDKDGNEKDAYVWIHPEAALTTESETEIDQESHKWTLKEAVIAMLWSCNPEEEFIRNPIRSDLQILDNAPSLDDVKLPIGKYLPSYLDSLLHPLGFNWHVTYIDDADTKYTKQKPTIKIWQKGIGDEKQIYMQAPGEVLNLDDTNCDKYRISRGIGDSVNQVKVLGAYEQIEVTIPLWRGWPVSSDSMTAGDLTKSTGASYEANPTVHRLWLANEAGDLTGTRSEITAALDLSNEFWDWYPHRRTIEDPFSYQGGDGEKKRRQLFIEYSIDAGASWNPIPDEFGQPFVMPDQIGILFQGDSPPEALIDAGDDARVRITGVVTGDSRLAHTATRQSHAVNGRVIEQVHDVPQKFRLTYVQDTGNFASVFAGDAAGADVADDSAAIQSYAEKLRDNLEAAELDCTFRLPGLHLEYEIGDLITTIAGRNVSLAQASSTAPKKKYVQVVKREFQADPPMTILTVDRGTRPPRFKETIREPRSRSYSA